MKELEIVVNLNNLSETFSWLTSYHSLPIINACFWSYAASFPRYFEFTFWMSVQNVFCRANVHAACPVVLSMMLFPFLWSRRSKARLLIWHGDLHFPSVNKSYQFQGRAVVSANQTEVLPGFRHRRWKSLFWYPSHHCLWMWPWWSWEWPWLGRSLPASFVIDFPNCSIFSVDSALVRSLVLNHFLGF